MATGKTNERWITFSWDGDDLSQYVDTINGVGIEHRPDDVTGFGDSMMAYTLGHPDNDISFSGPFSTQLWAVNADVGVETGKTLLVDYGVRAAATTGDPRFSQTNMTVYSFRVNNNRIEVKAKANYSGTIPTFTTTP